MIVLDLDLTLLCTDEDDGRVPYQPKRMANSKHAELLPLIQRSHLYSFHMFDPACEREMTMYGCFRTGYRQFLKWARDNFDYVVVWSAGRRAYVHELVTKIWKGMQPPDLVMTFNDLELNGDVYTKPLIKVANLLKISMDTILLIDDNPHVSVDNPDNTVLLPEFNPQVEDVVLYELMTLLNEREISAATHYPSMGLRNLMRDEATDHVHYRKMVEV